MAKDLNKKLFITADDIGAVESIDKAVEELVSEQCLDCVSVFVTGNVDLAWLKRIADKVLCGLHFTLTFGRPLGDKFPQELLNAEGGFRYPEKPMNANQETIHDSLNSFFKWLGSIDQKVIENELRRQVAKFKELMGFAPFFINTHHDIDICDNVFSAIKSVCPGYSSRQYLLRKGGYLYNFHFLSDDDDEDSAYELISRLISTGEDFLNNGGDLAEIVFHPAFPSSALSEFTSYTNGRYLEYGALKRVFTRRDKG